MKLWTFRLATIALPFLPLISYAYVDTATVKHQCESLKPGTEYVIQMTQKELDEQFKKVIKSTGCEIKIENKNWKPVVVITKEESDEDLLAGLEDMWTWPVKEPDWMKAKEQQVNAKEQQIAQKEKIKYLAYQSLNFNKWLALILKNYKKLPKKEVLDGLNKLEKIISNYSIIWDERERENILEWLNALKLIYSNDSEILKILNDIEKKVRASKLNRFISSR